MNKTVSFIAGGVIGTVAALLLAPRSGEQTRALVADKVDQYRDQGEEVFQRSYDQVQGKVKDVAGDVKPAVEDIRVKINEARDRIAEQVTRDKAAVKTVQADVISETDEVGSIAGDIVDEIAHTGNTIVSGE